MNITPKFAVIFAGCGNDVSISSCSYNSSTLSGQSKLTGYYGYYYQSGWTYEWDWSTNVTQSYKDTFSSLMNDMLVFRT